MRCITRNPDGSPATDDDRWPSGMRLRQVRRDWVGHGAAAAQGRERCGERTKLRKSIHHWDETKCMQSRSIVVHYQYVLPRISMKLSTATSASALAANFEYRTWLPPEPDIWHDGTSMNERHEEIPSALSVELDSLPRLGGFRRGIFRAGPAPGTHVVAIDSTVYVRVTLESHPGDWISGMLYRRYFGEEARKHKF